jgi:putative spermidine/putrescine transport system permease protein
MSFAKALRITFATLAVGFLVAPLLAILPLAFTSSEILSYPIPQFSLRWFNEIFTEPVWYNAILNSFIISGGATLLSTVLGCAAALGLRHRMPLGGAIKVLFLLPMVVPAVVIGVGMQMMYVQFGLQSTFLGTIFAHTVIAVPFVIVIVSSALKGVDQRLVHAALSLKASPVVAFWTVTFPLILPGVLSGAVLAFATSLDEVVLTLFVAGPNQRTLARQMFSTVRDNISPAIAAAAFLFIVGTIIVGVLMLALRSPKAKPAA